MAKREHVPLKTKLAAALLAIQFDDGNGGLAYLVDHDHAKAMTPDQIVSLFRDRAPDLAQAVQERVEDWIKFEMRKDAAPE